METPRKYWPVEKMCNKCGQIKPLDAFSRNKDGKYGRKSYCKDCCAKYQKEYTANLTPDQKEKRKEYCFEWARNHPANRAAVQKKWRQTHKEYDRQRKTKWAQEHPEKNREGAKKWRAKHPDIVIARWKEWHKQHAEFDKAWHAKWSREHPEYTREKSCKRRALKAAVPNEKIDLRIVFDRDKGICGICGLPVDPANWHLDHIIPLSKGGPHTYTNVQVAHPFCNLSKGNKVMEGEPCQKYRESIGQ